MDQRNSFRRALERGDAVYGAKAATFSPAVVEIYGELGLDFVWLDFEHTGPSPYDSSVFENLSRAAEVGGTELLVRLPSVNPPLIRKVLDAGVRNLLIPRVDDAEGVRDAVEATRFEYEGAAGERGMASGRSRAYGSAENYAATEDEEVCLGVMIEKTTAVENIDDIVSVPELGFVFLGPGDLSVQHGRPNDRDHPEVQSSIETVRDAAVSAGVPAGCIRNDPDAVATAVDDGYQVVRMGSDLGSVRSVLGDRIDAIRD